jgi:hypothetical protein
LYNLTLNYDAGFANLVSSSSYLHRDTLYINSGQYIEAVTTIIRDDAGIHRIEAQAGLTLR